MNKYLAAVWHNSREGYLMLTFWALTCSQPPRMAELCLEASGGFDSYARSAYFVDWDDNSKITIVTRRGHVLIDELGRHVSIGEFELPF